VDALQDTTILGITGENPMVIIITMVTRAGGIITDIRSALRSMEITMRDGTSEDMSLLKLGLSYGCGTRMKVSRRH
jgi:hypothetical protein